MEKNRPIVVNEPGKGPFSTSLREILDHRDLFYFLVWRDILVRYKQTFLGASWAILQPLAAMLIFTIFFGRLAKIPSDGVPYPVFSYSALVLWSFFASSLMFSGRSLVSSERLVTKVYFPRITIPVASVAACLVDLAIASCLLLILIPLYGIGLSANIWALPLMVMVAVVTAVGTGLLISALTVKYRDFRYVVPFLTQFWMFASPVVYPASLVPEKWRLLFGLNPMAGAIEGFRWALLGTGAEPWALVGTSTLASIVILVIGVFYFNRTEDYFADLI
jgi:lipopolysaccharide transport system permease protein